MKVGFDLDNTLIRCGFDFATEEPEKRLLFVLSGQEKLRAGTKDIFDFCRKNRLETWIYTTSFRSEWYIYKLFWLYGIHLSGVINQQKHTKQVKIKATKYPPQFGIDILIDDSEGVKMEGEKHHFKVITVAPDNEKWTELLKEQILVYIV